MLVGLDAVTRPHPDEQGRHTLLGRRTLSPGRDLHRRARPSLYQPGRPAHDAHLGAAEDVPGLWPQQLQFRELYEARHVFFVDPFEVDRHRRGGDLRRRRGDLGLLDLGQVRFRYGMDDVSESEEPAGLLQEHLPAHSGADVLHLDANLAHLPPQLVVDH